MRWFIKTVLSKQDCAFSKQCTFFTTGIEKEWNKHWSLSNNSHYKLKQWLCIDLLWTVNTWANLMILLRTAQWSTNTAEPLRKHRSVLKYTLIQPIPTVCGLLSSVNATVGTYTDVALHIIRIQFFTLLET